MTEAPGAGAGDPFGSGPGDATGATGAAGGFAADWPRKAADAVDLLVDIVHDKAVRPAALVARAVVFGLLIAALALVVVVLVSVALVRLLDVYAFGGRVWISYAVLGGLFTLAGLAAWSRRYASGSAGSR